MSRASRLLGLLGLGGVLLTSLLLRVRLAAYTPRYDAEDETGYFRTESAFQYRYARLVAQGKAIPELDRDAQHPEGVRTRRELTTLMERSTGSTFRLLRPPLDFRRFVILWVAAVSSLSIAAFYWLGLRLTRSPPLALSAAAAYGLSWASQSNLIGTYVFESFALPLIHWSLAFFAAALDPEERRPGLQAAASGLLLAAALASWHFTRFYLGSLLLALAWASWRLSKDGADLGRLRSALGMLLAFALASGLLVASLRENLFILSPMMILGCGLWLALRFESRAPAIACAAAALAALRLLGASDAGAYGHVYALLWAKLRYGLAKPADPELLSSETHMLWMGPFNSPDPGFALFSLLPLGLMLLPRALMLAGRGGSHTTRVASPSIGPALDALFLLYALGAAMVLRLMPMLVFFLGLCALRLPPGLLQRPWLAAGFAALAGLEGLKTYAPSSRINPFMGLAAALTPEDKHPATSFKNELALIHWLRRHAGPEKPVLANIAFSPSLLTYAGSPILLHTKFETAAIRRKTAEFLKALYQDEESFHAYCRKYGAALFVYTTYDVLDETPDGPRYASASLRLSSNTAAVLFHFHPERLKRFRLVYQNEDFRVFAAGPGGGYPADPGPSSPVYDIARFNPQIQADGTLLLDVAGALARLKKSRFQLLMARVLARMGRGEEALAAYEEAFAAWPPDAESRLEAQRLREALERR